MEGSPSAQRRVAPLRARRRTGARGSLLGGGIDGNEQLTAMAGVILTALLAALGITILRIGQLIWLHLFLGLLLVGPLFLKVASTAYRFIRYYMRDAIYVAKGPPMLALRAMGPLLVLSTVAVFASGVVLLFVGPRNRDTSLLIHKASFIVWGVLFGLHLIAHVPSLPRSLRAVRLGDEARAPDGLNQGGLAGHSGAAGRWIALAGTLVAGMVLAIVLIPDFSLWTAAGAFPHHHH
jgi:hypothetical protein